MGAPVMAHSIPPRSADTDVEAEHVQIALLRRFSPAQRAELALSLTDTVIDAARRGLIREHPHASKEEIDALFVEIHYGKALADGFRSALAKARHRGTACPSGHRQPG